MNAKSTVKNRIDHLFADRQNEDKIMSLFLTAGYPDLNSTVDLMLGLEKNGTDMIELGMPFSDPLADGPTIQFSSTRAIENGITMQHIFKIVAQFRQHSDMPVILMGYLNPMLHFGIDDFCHEAASAGVDGLIIPDLPPEESGLLEEAGRKHGMSLIFLVAPNTSSKRMQLIDKKSQGFVYCVSVTGVTGEREGGEVSSSVEKFIARVQDNIIKNPTMIGFGIKSHEDAIKIAAHARGFIVGSALINAIKEHYPTPGWKEKVFAFVKRLKYG